MKRLNEMVEAINGWLNSTSSLNKGIFAIAGMLLFSLLATVLFDLIKMLILSL